MIQILDENKSKEGSSNSEWGPGAAEAMCNEVRDFKLHGGKDGKVLTMGDMIDRTPKGMISKVMLEEKLFDTWYGGRTVLIGDGKDMFACMFVWGNLLQWSSYFLPILFSFIN